MIPLVTSSVARLVVKGGMPAPLTRISQATICNGNSTVYNVGRLKFKGYCG